MRRLLSTLVAGCVMAGLAIAVQLAQPVVVWTPTVRKVFAAVNWPTDMLISAYATAFHDGNTDQSLLFGMVLWVLYWITLGLMIAAAIQPLCRIPWRWLRHSR
jgi:hypothetical protein